MHLFARPWPPREGIARYVESIAIAQRHIKSNAKILLISLWNYDKAEVVDIKNMVLLKIPRHRKGITRVESVYALYQKLQLNRLLNVVLHNHLKEAVIHVHMPVYIKSRPEYTIGVTFHGYISVRSQNIKLVDMVIPMYIIKALCRDSKFITSVGISSAVVCKRELRVDCKPVLTPIPFDVLNAIKSQDKVECDLMLIFARKDPVTAFNILKQLILDHEFKKYVPEKIVILGLKRQDITNLARRGLGNVYAYKHVSRNTLLQLLNSSRLFIYASRGIGEGVPTLVLEALAMGTPTIVPRVQGCIDLAKMHGLPIYDNYKRAAMLAKEVLSN